MNKFTALLFTLWLVYAPHVGFGQSDPIQRVANNLREQTAGRVTLTLEERTRWEERYGVSFGKAANQQDMLSRLRIGLDYRPVPWLTLSSMGQDARAPFFGSPAPNSMRDSLDLHEAYIAIAPPGNPLNFSAGRRMLNYGETRIFGTPQWSNTSRTYDFARMEYASKFVVLDGLLASPVIVLQDAFNKPELGNRVWGFYGKFPKLYRNSSADAYVLRHSQNKIGGWIGAGTLGTDSLGLRLYGPLPLRLAYSLEGIGQLGHSGTLDQRAFADFAAISRPFTVGRFPLLASLEWKEASGSTYGSDHSATFDQLCAANHDKFGHQDLFGWRNLRTFKSLITLNITRTIGFNVLYANHSLFSASDALYNGAGSKISSSKKGTAGTRVGQEIDSFMTMKFGAHTVYAGFGHFFRGEFVQNTTPGINPRYFYVAQQYNLN